MADAHEIHVVEVTTDHFPRGKKQLWLAAVRRDDAVTAVLNAITEGWTAKMALHHLRSGEANGLKMTAGTVRELSR